MRNMQLSPVLTVMLGETPVASASGLANLQAVLNSRNVLPSRDVLRPLTANQELCDLP